MIFESLPGNNETNSTFCLRDFSNLLTAELRLRKLSILGTLDVRRNRLRDVLKVELRLELVMQAIDRGEEGKEAALLLISQAIPCIMHLENRVGEKIITVLLSLGAELFQRRRTKSLAVFASSIMRVVNTRVLGTLTRPKQWKMLLSKNNEAVLKVSLSNSKTRKFVSEIGVLIDYVFHHPEDAEKKHIWHTLIQDYSDAMDILLMRSEYTDEHISEFQRKIDDFFAAYVEKSGAGKEGVTNYIHMLASGHIRYYMITHRNLYKYSQQGWESLNEKFKLTFFNNTQRGGNFGKNTDEAERSYLKSVYRAFQRELLWVSGLAEDYFLTKDN